ncbi:MAG: DUF2945 domain-containing protein [Planctomycetota bacterium]
MSDHSFKEGDAVKWKWGDSYAHGKIKSIFPEKTTRKIGGSEVTRHGSQDDPALYIENTKDDSNNVLKLASEVEKD